YPVVREKTPLRIGKYFFRPRTSSRFPSAGAIIGSDLHRSPPPDGGGNRKPSAPPTGEARRARSVGRPPSPPDSGERTDTPARAGKDRGRCPGSRAGAGGTSAPGPPDGERIGGARGYTGAGERRRGRGPEPPRRFAPRTSPPPDPTTPRSPPD